MANVEHSVLTGSDLHEPKGVAAAAANRVYLSNGAGSGSWTTVPAAAITAAGVLVFQGQFYHVRDERSSGTGGDDVLTASTWNTRVLNSEKTDDLTVTAAGNQISLAAGTYYAEAEVGTRFSGTANNGSTQVITSKLRLRNATDSTTLVVGQGSTFQCNDDSGGNNQTVDITLLSKLSGRFTIAGTKAIEVQNWIVNPLSGPVTRGGKALSSGENEVYLDIKLWKLS